MGDAIFGSYKFWSDYDSILIVWGDQVNLSPNTIEQVVKACQGKKTVVLPLTRQEEPYVQYDFQGERLIGVRQRREHDCMDAVGESDVGVFALSVTGVCDAWSNYLKIASVGTGTGEINFTPFLPYLSREAGWQVIPIMVSDVEEARGINTPADLEFAKSRLAARTKTSERKP
jgi:bifunctional UDP-N-acetylglucosamine pyrophosphorylase/glucosamine-1-phosphate N-acetyltransferase